MPFNLPWGRVLSPGQLRVFAAVLACFREKPHQPPSVPEIAARLQGPAGCYHWVWTVLGRLRKAGLIDFDNGKKRTLQLRVKITRE